MTKLSTQLQEQTKAAPWQRLGLREFAELLAVPSANLPAECRQIIRSTDFRFRFLAGRELENALLALIKRLDAGDFNVAGPAKKKSWDFGWEENRRAFIKSNYCPAALIPKYYRPHELARYQGRLVASPNPRFIYDVFRVIRAWLVERYLAEYPVIGEYGCGPGHNLVAMARRFPEKKFYGFDWAKSVPALLRVISQRLRLPIEGHFFNMFHPGKALRLKMPASAVTFGAFEQLGDSFQAFYRYLRHSGFALCLHVEPVIEFYNEKLLLDYLAIRHHRQRNLLGHYLAFLRQEAARGGIAIERAQRIRFGSALEEGWSVIVWRAIRGK